MIYSIISLGLRRFNKKAPRGLRRAWTIRVSSWLEATPGGSVVMFTECLVSQAPHGIQFAVGYVVCSLRLFYF